MATTEYDMPQSHPYRGEVTGSATLPPKRPFREEHPIGWAAVIVAITAAISSPLAILLRASSTPRASLPRDGGTPPVDPELRGEEVGRGSCSGLRK